ncbi:MAG: hypothetical protein LQ352_002631 [Teloschistes flavicans]|nr:MAG: hypothetical protein LQ352_002631 [Teloschistes flavicans]
MSTPKRQSPRAAIREWLAHTDQAAASVAKHDVKPKKQKGVKAQEEGPRLSHRPREVLRSPQRQTAKTPSSLAEGHLQSLQHPSNHRQRPTEDRNLAEQLGLHAPFRAFAARGAESGFSPQHKGGRHKRRRSLSEASSYLEPAVRIGDGDDGSESLQDAAAKRAPCGGKENDEQISSRSASVAIVPTNGPSKMYERRSRHKTKEDCYDLKQAKKRNQAKERKNGVGDRRKKKKRKDARKSGAALMQDFNAGNVKAERLTGEKEERSGPVHKKARQKNGKAADTEAEFSRFFAATKNQGDGVEGTTMHSRRKSVSTRMGDRSDELERPSLPPVDLPEKPFLGFGSCGPGHDSPALFKASVSGASSHVTGPHRPPSGRSTTCFTWSRSGTAETANLTRHPRHSDANDTSPPNLHGHRAVDRDCGPDKRTALDVRHASGTPSNRSYELRRAQPHRGSEDCTNVGPSTVLAHENSKSINTNCKKPRLEDQPEQPAKQQQDQSNHAHLSTAGIGRASLDLASMLATSNQSELLGAVLDTLLSKVTTQDLKSKLGLKTSGSMDNEAIGDSEMPQQKYRTQTSKECDSPRAANQPSALPDRPENNNTAASSRSNQSSHGPQQSASISQQADDHNLHQTPGHQAPNPTQDGCRTYEKPRMSHIPKIVNQRPDSSSAWTGYCHLYEDQFDERALEYSFHEGIVEHDLDGADWGQIEIDQPPEGFVDALESGDTFSNHQRDEDNYIPQVFTEHTWHHPSYQNSQHNRNVMEGFDQTRDRLLSSEQELHEVSSLNAGNSRSPWSRDSVAEPSFDYSSDNIQRPETASFLGGKGFAAVESGQIHTPWKPDVRPMTRDDVRILPAPSSSIQDGEGVGAMPLTRFWKPHRLY